MRDHVWESMLYPAAEPGAEIELDVAAAPLRTIGEPYEEKVRPRTAYHAKFSGPYTVASALIRGEHLPG
ncbi:hypothetical protein [Streptosporangium sp. CA-115845]|uniref:hypothetical protein n=1 Tax=Streptosporangium sp. CA-115845 TaxID=3240071 RepID=UPI003D90C961